MNVFEPWTRAVDMSTSDVDIYDEKDKVEKLYPYPVDYKNCNSTIEMVMEQVRIESAEKHANSFEGVKERIRIIDAVILKGLRV